MTEREGRKPRVWRTSTRLRRTRSRPTVIPTSCPITVARAAPATSRRGNGPRPKMSRGSRSRLTTAPMPWMHMGPTASPLAWSTAPPKTAYTRRASRGDDGKVLTAVVDDLRYVGEQRQKGAAEQHARDQKDQPAAQVEEVAVHCHGAGLGGAAFPQAAGEYGVYADAGPHADGNHQGLYRIGQGQRHKSVGAELGHEHAVHQIIQGLDQHGEHHGP